MSHHTDHIPGTFDFTPRTRFVYGPNTIDRTGTLARSWEAERALIVTDTHLVAAGHVDRARASLEAAGVSVAIYDAVRENPTTEDVDNCLAAAMDFRPDTIVGLGGGSSLDTAKGANFLYTNGGRMADYWGVGKATKPMLPLIAIPTTAGTGSEAQSFALIADAESHQKMACGDPKAAARVSILDPTLTVTQPRLVTADTGVDALAHAVECAVTNVRSELSLMYAHRAFALINTNFRRVFEAPDDLDARGGMLLAAALAGTAIENSMLGAVHSAANPLTAHFDVVHGQAVGVMLAPVVRFNAADPTAAALYRDLAIAGQLVGPDADTDAAIDALVAQLDALLDAADLPRSLGAHGVDRAAIPTLAAEAAGQWTANFNPRPVKADDFIALYESVFAPAPVA